MHFGYVPSLPDSRDLPLVGTGEALFGTSFGVTAPPQHFELIRQLDRVCDQAGTNSCVWQAIQQQHFITQGVQKTGKRAKLSRLFGYWMTRHRTGLEKNDIGCQPREAWKAAKGMGFPLETMWPFEPQWVNAKPDFDAVAAAVDQRWFEGYYAITERYSRAVEIKQAISQGHPVVLGTVVGTHFKAYRGGGPPKDLKRPTDSIGRHMMCAVAYDEVGLWVVNSWGEGWGGPDPTGKFPGGFARLPWDWIAWEQVTDVWACKYAKEFAA